MDKTAQIKRAKLRKLLLGTGKKDGLLMRIFIYFFLIVIAYVFVRPILEMLLTSLMSSSDLVDPEVTYLPKKFQFSNYAAAFRVLQYPKALFNSIWFSALLAVIQTLITALAGYSFARYKFKGKKFWFAILIVTFLVPAQVLVIPRTMMISLFQQSTGVKVMGTILPQILFTLLGQGIYSTILILICYNFFKQIPIDLDEAAVMDGATPAQTFYHVIIKLSVPIIFTVFLFSFVWNWNDSFSTSYYIGSKLALLPTQLSLFDSLFSSEMVATRANESYKMAGSLISIIPLIILYIFVQRKFVEGIEQTGLTGQ